MQPLPTSNVVEDTGKQRLYTLLVLAMLLFGCAANAQQTPGHEAGVKGKIAEDLC